MEVRYFSEFVTYFCKGLLINARDLHNKISVDVNVPDEHNLITVICLTCQGVVCPSPDKSKLE